MMTDDLKEQIARSVLDALENLRRSHVRNPEAARKCLERAIQDRVAMRYDWERPVEYRTCVRPDDKTVHLQIRGPADVLDRLAPVPEPDDMDEQMCDDWTDWKEV